MRNLFHTIFYWVNIKTWVWLIITWAIDRKVEGLDRIPRKGPLILASNHLNLADPPILTAIIPRRIAWLAKKELFDFPVIGMLYHFYGCIPVRRFHADLRALRRSEQALREGLVLGMFPEGTRSGGKGLGPGEPGTALLALRTDAPILPVAIWGTESIKLPRDFFRRTSVHVVFGEPFRLPRAERVTKRTVDEGTETIMRKIAELLPERYRGAYADRPQEQPKALKVKEGTR